MGHVGVRRAVPALLSAMLALAACGGASSPSPSGGGPAASTPPAPTATPQPTPMPEPDKVTILTDFLLFGWHSPLFAGKAEGIYEKHGIDLSIEPGAGSADGATKIATGAAQFGQIDAISSLTAIGRGADLALVGVYFAKHPGGMCYIEERHQIASYADLEGLKIGAAAGDAYMVALPGLMEAAGADPEGYEVVTMEGSATSAALVAGQVDATPCGLPTFSSRAAAADQSNLTADFFSFADNGFNTVGFVLVTSGATVRDDPDLVQRMVNAWAESAIWSLENADDAVAAFIAANSGQNEDLAKQSFSDVQPLIRGESGYFTFDTDRLEASVDFVNEAYDVTIDVDDVYTDEFVSALPESLKQGELP